MLTRSSSGSQVERQNQCCWHLTSLLVGGEVREFVLWRLKCHCSNRRAVTEKHSLFPWTSSIGPEAQGLLRTQERSSTAWRCPVEAFAGEGILPGVCCFFHLLPLASLCLSKVCVILPLATLQLAFKGVKSTYPPRLPLYQVSSQGFTTSCFKVIGIIMCRKITFLMVAWKIYIPKM